MIKVNCFRGQGVRVEGRGYGTIQSFASETEVRVKFRGDVVETIRIDELLSAAAHALDSVAQRFNENDIELNLPSLKFADRSRELEPELSDDEPEEFKEEYVED